MGMGDLPRGRQSLRGDTDRAETDRTSPRTLHNQLGRAWTVIPGLVHVRDLKIQQHSKDIVWHLTIDRAVTGINLLALISKTRKSADRLDRILAIHDLEGGAHLAVKNGSTHIKDLSAQGGLGNLCLQKKSHSGAIYIKYGLLSLGVEISGEDEKKHLIGPRKWYDEYVGVFTCSPPGGS